MDYINQSLHNRLWVIVGDEKSYLNSVGVARIDWLTNGECVVILEGLLQLDRWLLDIWDKEPVFEIHTSVCGDPTEYESDRMLMRMENLRSLEWWTNDVVTIRNDSICTTLYCSFLCDWIKICE